MPEHAGVTAFASGIADAAFFSGLDHKASFLFVRHGQSEGNARSIVQGLLDLPLDDLGRAQARDLAPWIATRAPDAVLCSPLARAAETAAILASALDDQPPVAPRHEWILSELDTGPFTGLSLDEARARHPAAYEAFLRESWDGVPGAESSAELYERAMRAWALLRDLAFGGAANIVVVTHGGFIQWLVKSTMGVRGWLPLLPMSNCGVSEFVVAPQPGGFVLPTWRRIDWHPPGLTASTAPVF